MDVLELKENSFCLIVQILWDGMKTFACSKRMRTRKKILLEFSTKFMYPCDIELKKEQKQWTLRLQAKKDMVFLFFYFLGKMRTREREKEKKRTVKVGLKEISKHVLSKTLGKLCVFVSLYFVIFSIPKTLFALLWTFFYVQSLKLPMIQSKRERERKSLHEAPRVSMLCSICIQVWQSFRKRKRERGRERRLSGLVSWLCGKALSPASTCPHPVSSLFGSMEKSIIIILFSFFWDPCIRFSNNIFIFQWSNCFLGFLLSIL